MRTSRAGSRISAIATLPATPSRPARAYLLSVGTSTSAIGSRATMTVMPEKATVRPAVAIVTLIAVSASPCVRSSR